MCRRRRGDVRLVLLVVVMMLLWLKTRRANSAIAQCVRKSQAAMPPARLAAHVMGAVVSLILMNAVAAITIHPNARSPKCTHAAQSLAATLAQNVAVLKSKLRKSVRHASKKIASSALPTLALLSWTNAKRAESAVIRTSLQTSLVRCVLKKSAGRAQNPSNANIANLAALALRLTTKTLAKNAVPFIARKALRTLRFLKAGLRSDSYSHLSLLW